MPKAKAARPFGGRRVKELADMALFDDLMFSTALDGNKPAVQRILRIVLKEADLAVKSAKTQYYIGNLGKRSVYLDILAVDGAGRRLNVEFQRDSREAGVIRACYHYAMLATRLMRKRASLDDLPDIYVIVFTERDYWKLGQAIYRIENMLAVEGGPGPVAYREVNDKIHIRYVNGEAKKDDGTEVGRLLHDLFCTDPDEAYFKELGEALGYYKRQRKGVRKMESVIEAYRMQGRLEGRKEGEKKGRAKMVRAMLGKGRLSIDDIAEYSGFSPAEVEQVKKRLVRKPARG